MLHQQPANNVLFRLINSNPQSVRPEVDFNITFSDCLYDEYTISWEQMDIRKRPNIQKRVDVVTEGV